jgi:phospholipid/cholesterol/gamma-HCH transport system substrate-binding protein
MNTLADQLAQRMDTLERVAKSAEQLGGAAQAVSGSAQSVAGSAQTVSGVVLNESLPRMNELLDELARTSRNLDRLISELNDQPHGLVFGRQPGRPGPGEAGFSGSGRSGGK